MARGLTSTSDWVPTLKWGDGDWILLSFLLFSMDQIKTKCKTFIAVGQSLPSTLLHKWALTICPGLSCPVLACTSVGVS